MAVGVAIVTGGASGLGEASARHLGASGRPVVVFDRNDDGAKSVAEDIGEHATWVAGSVLSPEDVERAIEAATSIGRLSVLVHCAGGGTGSGRLVGRDGTPHDYELFADTVALNLTGSFNVLRLVATAMARNPPVDGERGSVVLTASIAGYEGQIGQIAYGSAKAGVIGMTLIAARDLAAVGVRVNCIAPGTIATTAWDAAPSELRDALAAQVPFPSRLGRPEEFAQLAAHLAENGYVNGEVVRLDGAIRFGPR